MPSRTGVLAYVQDTYGIGPDYPWPSSPNFAILRHDGTRKWFGAVMDITMDKLGEPSDRPVDALNVKCDPLLMGSFLCEKGIYPAYHMNKEHWLTVLLDGTVEEETIQRLIDISYGITRSTVKQRRRS